MSRRGKVWLIAALLVVLAGLFSMVGVLNGRARSVTRIVMDRWQTTLGSPEQIFAEHPARTTNEPAVELAEAAAAIGIDLGPRLEDLPRPTPETVERYRGFKRAAYGWLDRELSRSAGRRQAPPAEARSFLRDHVEEIGRVEDLLLREQSPAWTTDLSRLWNAPIPNLIGHTELNKLLLARSFDCLEAHAAACSERALEASWRLAETLRDDPTLIVFFMRLNLVRLQASAVRGQPWLVHWIPRLDGRSYREEMERALLHEGWLWPQVDYRAGAGQGIADRVQAMVAGPYMELASADVSERWRRKILQLRGLETWCRDDIRAAGVRLDLVMPWWNRFGSLLAFDIDMALGRLVVAQQQFELTRKVLELGIARRETGAWPDPDDAWLSSAFCSDTHWVYTREAGEVTLRIDRIPDNTQEARGPLTWEYRLSAELLEAPARRAQARPASS